MSFSDKVVLVTGASRNTGLTIASAFAAEGATVFVHDRTTESVENAVTELKSRGFESIIPIAADLNDPVATQNIFTEIRNQTKRLDVLVNNAVEMACGYSFEDVPIEIFENTIRTNLIGLFHVAREASRMMIAQGGGAIVNISSAVSERAIRNRSAYCASKGGVDALTRSMVIDLAIHGIRVNTVAPGYIHSKRWATLPAQDIVRRRTNIPFGKETTGEDIANAVLFLASDQATAIHGTRLVIDGGCSAQHFPQDADV